MRMVHAPLSEEDVRSLRLGEVVGISGPIVTARDEAHMRALEKGPENSPGCLRGCVLFHCGPIVSESDGIYSVVAAGPTTSARMDKLEAEMIRRFGIRAVIGKGGMSSEVADAMRECDCVYLAAVGGAAVTYAESLTVTGVEWKDLGMAEAVWEMDASSFGPLVVAIDADGDSLYESVRKRIRR